MLLRATTVSLSSRRRDCSLAAHSRNLWLRAFPRLRRRAWSQLGRKTPRNILPIQSISARWTRAIAGLPVFSRRLALCPRARIARPTCTWNWLSRGLSRAISRSSLCRHESFCAPGRFPCAGRRLAQLASLVPARELSRGRRFLELAVWFPLQVARWGAARDARTRIPAVLAALPLMVEKSCSRLVPLPANATR